MSSKKALAVMWWPWVAGFFLLNLILLIFHETGLTDALSWTEAGTVGWNEWMDFAGTSVNSVLSPLWSLILSGLSWLSLPIFSANILSLAFATLALALFLQKIDKYIGRHHKENSHTSHIPPIFRRHLTAFQILLYVIFTFSAGFLYHAAVISSGVALGALALAIIASLYDHRHERPVLYMLSLLLLCASWAGLVGLAAALAVGWVVERWRRRTLRTDHISSLVSYRMNFWQWSVVIMVSMLIILNLAVIVLRLFYNFSLSGISELDDFMLDYNFVLFGITFPIIELMLIFTLTGFLIKFPKLAFYELITLIIYLPITYYSQLRLGVITAQVTLIINIFLCLYLIMLMENPRKSHHLEKIELVKLYQKYLTAGAFIIIPVSLTIPTTITSAISEITSRYDYLSELTETLDSLPSGAEIAIAGLDEKTQSRAMAAVSQLGGKHAVVSYDNETFLKRARVESSTSNNEPDNISTDIDEDVYEIWDNASGLYLLTATVTCGNNNALTNLPTEWERLGEFDGLSLYQVK